MFYKKNNVFLDFFGMDKFTNFTWLFHANKLVVFKLLFLKFWVINSNSFISQNKKNMYNFKDAKSKKS